MAEQGSVYLDNAATTPLHPRVKEAMLPFLEHDFGNPSSVHSHGRKVRSAIEKARKMVADHINAAPAEVFFTSGGTEADNMAIMGAVQELGIQHIITAETEHHAVLHPIEFLGKCERVQVHYLNLDEQGFPDMKHLEELLQKLDKVLVSLMFGNNEIGNVLDIERISKLCRKHEALFHTDTVQAMGHHKFDLEASPVDFLTASGHKFHGPKGTGFLYINPRLRIPPYIHGGSQERNMRGGTENTYGIIGLATALDLMLADFEKHEVHIKHLKSKMIDGLQKHVEGVAFNGASADLNQSLHHILNVSLPPSDISEMLLFNLDIAGISASGGSACTSGSLTGSHVLNAIGADPDRGYVRFSFSILNTEEEIDYAIDTLSNMYQREEK